MKKLIATCSFVLLTFSLLLNVGGCIGSHETGSFTIEKKQKLTIGSTGATLPILKKIADSYMDRNKNVIIEIPVSLNNEDAAKNIEEGNLDIGLSSIPVENNKNLQQRLFARTIVVIAVNPSVSIASLTKQQVMGIYAGKIRNWREVGGTDSKIIVLSNLRGRSTMIALDKYVKGFADLKGPSDTIVLKNTQAMNEAITSIQDSIGFSDIGAIKAGDLKIKPLAIQGISPTIENYETGIYPAAKNLYLLTTRKPSKLAEDFVDFVIGWEGKKLILDNGYLSPDER